MLAVIIIIGVAFIEGLFCTNCSFGTWVPGRYIEVAFIQGWPLRGVPLYKGLLNRGITVYWSATYNVLLVYT